MQAEEDLRAIGKTTNGRKVTHYHAGWSSISDRRIGSCGEVENDFIGPTTNQKTSQR